MTLLPGVTVAPTSPVKEIAQPFVARRNDPFPCESHKKFERSARARTDARTVAG